MTTESAAADTTTATTDSTDTAITTSTAATEQPAGEGQGGSEDTAATETADTSTEEQAVEGAPEAYEAFTLPEGITLEGERATKAIEFFKAHNYTQAQAQEAVDLFVALQAENAEAWAAERTQRIEQWGTETRSKFATEFDAMNGDVRVAFNALKTPEFEKALDEEGWGNHPELFRVFAAVGKLMRESNPKGMGGNTAVARREDLPIADRMFGPD